MTGTAADTNYTPVLRVSTLAARGDIYVRTCRRCGALVLEVDDGSGRNTDLHDAWHDDLAHQLAQARA